MKLFYPMIQDPLEKLSTKLNTKLYSLIKYIIDNDIFVVCKIEMFENIQKFIVDEYRLFNRAHISYRLSIALFEECDRRSNGTY